MSAAIIGIVIAVPNDQKGYALAWATTAGAILQLIIQYPNIRKFAELPEKGELMVALLLRAAGMPATVASLYMGATGFRFRSYLIGSVAGMLPLVIAYTVMGVGAGDRSSPVFWAAVVCCCAVSVAALLLSARILRRKPGDSKQ